MSDKSRSGLLTEATQVNLRDAPIEKQAPQSQDESQESESSSSASESESSIDVRLEEREAASSDAIVAPTRSQTSGCTNM